MLVSVFLAALALPAAANAASATLHVDQNDPNCSDTGSGTETEPFCTISAAASTTKAGTTVLVYAGTYNEQVSARSGGLDNPVVFKAAAGATVTVRGQKYGFYVSGKSWVTIQGFNVTDTTSDGIHVSSGSKQIKVVENDVSSAGEPVSGKTGKGISVTDVTDVLVQDNTVHHNSNYGIYVVNSTRITIVGNESSFNAKEYTRAASGIRLHSSDGNTISSNVSHDNEDTGIELVMGSDDNLVVNNVTYHNGDHGIDVLESLRDRVVANSVYDNVTAGINAEGGSTGTTLANNISVDNGVDSPRTRGNIRVDSMSTDGTAIDYDLVYLRTSGTMFVWGSTSYSSLSAFAAATGQESHGIEAGPRWTDRASGDLHLEPGSPAIDSADAGASGQPTTDADGNERVDDPATANTGAGPRAYDDRGAYEYQLRDAPPTAALTVTPSSGTAPLSVTADASASTDDDGTSPIESYTFDFGAGSPVVGPQAEATASHTYILPGTYTVTVTVEDTAGLSAQATANVVVTLADDDPPTAALTVTPSSGYVGLTVTADASASTDDDLTSPIESYTFDFGDGSAPQGPQAEATATHTYTVAGTYTATVTVTDSAGLSSTATASVVAKANLVGNPGFESGTSGWNTSGSGTGVTLERVSGGYKGDWAAKLTNTETTSGNCALNDAPNWVTTTSAGAYTASVWVRADAAGATLRLRLREYSGTTFVGSATAQVTLATSWQQVNVTYTPGSPGSSTLDYGAYVPSAAPGTCFYADEAGIYFQDSPPAASLTVSPSSGREPLAVTADASGSTDGDASSPIESFTFDFGDGSAVVGPQAEATATHTYTVAGIYTAKVTVKDGAGLSSTATQEVTVTDDPPVAALTVTPSSGSAPLAVTADASASTDSGTAPIASYTFDFGDGSAVVGPQAEATATHTYTVAGTYTAKVTVKDSARQSSTATAQVAVSGNLVGNSGFETDTSGWNTSGSGTGITLERVSGGHTGDWAAKLTNTGTTSSTCTLNDAPNWVSTTSAGTYTASLWVRADAAGATFKLRLREYSGGTFVGSATAQITLTTSWQQVSVTYTPASPGSSTLDYNAYVTGAASGTCFYADDAVLSLG